MSDEEIQNEIDKLEKETIEFLEADMKRQANACKKKINKLNEQLELFELRKQKSLLKDLNLAMKFIKEKGMMVEFEAFKEKE